jgi:TolB-like protein
MKTNFLVVFFLGLLLLLGCASNSFQDKQLTGDELEKSDILGTVQTSFVLDGRNAGTLFLPPTDDDIKKMAYSKLLEEAQKNYSGNIDVRNINVSQSSKKMKLALSIGGVGVEEYTYNSTGNVIRSSSSARTAGKLEGITNQIMNAFRGNKNVTIAIFDFVNINGKTSVLGRYLVEQISNYFFQNSDLKIVERAQIDKVLKEQEFGMSGNVSDETAARIGHMLGANAVTIGTLTKVGNRISVNIKIVDSETASLISSGSTEIDGDEYIEMYNEYF